MRLGVGILDPLESQSTAASAAVCLLLKADVASIRDKQGGSISTKQCDDVALWIARFAVQRYCGLSMMSESDSLENFQNNLIAKVVFDTHQSARAVRNVPVAHAASVRNTSLLLFREAGQTAPLLQLASLSFCLAFFARTLARWESLAAGDIITICLEPAL